MDVGVHEAKTHFSKLLRQVAMGEEITILRSGRPVARLVPPTTHRPRDFGRDRGRMETPGDFDAPLPAEVQQAFEG